MKSFQSPFAFPTDGVTKAWLVGSPCGTQVTYDLTIGTDVLTTADTIAPGVYTLKIVSDCGCHSMLVYVPPCTITIPGTYDGDGGVPEPIPSCDTTRCDKPKINCLTLATSCTAPVVNALA